MRHWREVTIVWAGAAVGLVLGCDGSGRDSGQNTGEPTCSEAAGIDACLGSPVTEEAAEQVANQIDGRDLSQDPPQITGMRVFPLKTASQYARLEAQIGEELPRVLRFIWNDRVNTLRDDGLNGDRTAGDHVYTAFIDMAFVRQAGLLGEALPASPQAAETGIPLPVFKRRISLAIKPKTGAEVEAITSALAGDNCVSSTGQSISCFVDQEKALLIRDLSVVNNSARTQDPCMSGSSTDANKVWTFGYLLTQMAGSSISPSAFALKWLDSWKGPSTTENNLSVSSVKGSSYSGTTPQLPVVLKSKWLSASNSTTTLAMNKAPFRLLAIVNRFDLRKNMFFGEGVAGELRFVFGVLNLNNDVREGGVGKGACGVMDVPGQEGPAATARRIQTVILEYAVDKADQNGVLAWAKSWLKLSQATMGSTDYLNQLQAITQSVVVKGVGSNFNKMRANGSALIRIRTNESGDDAIWDLREFTIDRNLHYPVARTVKQTPRTLFNNSDNLGQWIVNNKAAILNGTHNVPATLPSTYPLPRTFLGAHAPNDTNFDSGEPDFGFQGYWAADGWLNYAQPDDVEARHLFSLNTCNGCHGKETKDPDQGFFFAHVQNRLYGQKSNLSSFLTGLPQDPATPPHDVYVPDPDPLVPAQQRYFNELYNRNEDMANFLFWGPTAQLAFQPSTITH